MSSIDVRCEATDDGWACRATVDDGVTHGEHRVTVGRADADRLAAAHDVAAVERLVDETVAFLLEREPRSSILAAFDVSVVSRYFPEYETEIEHRLAP